jgi:hypothetical protein
MSTITERIDGITQVPPTRMKAALPAPRSVKIEISPRCNYRCGFCALRSREVQPKWDMDFGLFKRVTREMREAGVEEVGVFYLGESFMNPRLLVDCIGYLKRELAMPYVFLTSNASMAFPLIVAGGIKSHAEVRALIALGAAAVQIGTPFAVTLEGDAHPNFKKVLADARPEDTVAVINSRPTRHGGCVRPSPCCGRTNIDHLCR